VTDLDTRLQALDPIPDPAALEVSDAALRSGLAAAFAAESPTIWTRLRSRTVAVIAGFVAVFAVGTGIAFAAGIPADVRRAFADEPMAPGAPVPWNAHDIRLAATLPLDRGRTLQIWTAVNDLTDGPCTDYQVVDPGGRARDLDSGCEAAYLAGKPGVAPHDPGVQPEYPAVQLDELLPDGPHGPIYDIAQIVAPGVVRAVLRVQGSRDRTFELDAASGWGVVRLPGSGDDGALYTGTPLVVLYDRAGHVVSTINLDTDRVTPDVFYRLDGTVDTRPSDPRPTAAPSMTR
jgi:hypothetical protein